MPEKRDYNLDGAIASVRKAENYLTERRADLRNALKEAQDGETALTEQVEDAKKVLGGGAN